MDLIASNGIDALRELDRSETLLDKYFGLVTPVDVIERMRLAQGPLVNPEDPVAWRNIPWSFAWAQSRFVLPSWYGFGTGLNAAIEQHGVNMIRDMIELWPFFSRLVTDVETALAIADLGIASQYSLLAGNDLHQQFFPAIESEYQRATAAILNVRENSLLLANNNTLRRSIRLRNPYVDPMSLLQIELLRRWRLSNRVDDALLSALIASVNGIARGLQTSG
jgi:phosphoenolpyruvate carboxylase